MGRHDGLLLLLTLPGNVVRTLMLSPKRNFFTSFTVMSN